MENQFKYTDEELQLIKSVFADDDQLLIILRKVLVGVDLNAVELARVNILQEDNTFKIIRKIVLPRYNVDSPIGQTSDIWSGLNLPTQIKDQMIPHIEAIKITIKYLEKRLDVLGKTWSGKTANLDSLLDGTFEGISARQSIIDIIEKSLLFLKVIAGNKEETTEEQKKRLIQNSSK